KAYFAQTTPVSILLAPMPDALLAVDLGGCGPRTLGPRDTRTQGRSAARSAVHQLTVLLLWCGGDKVWNEIGSIRRAEPRHRIPARRRAITGDRRIDLIAELQRVKKVIRVFHRVARDLIERRVDVADVVPLHLIGNRDQARPLRRTCTR